MLGCSLSFGEADSILLAASHQFGSYPLILDLVRLAEHSLALLILVII